MPGAVWPLGPLVLCARWEEWFWWWTFAHFGEAREGFPVGKICLRREHRQASGIEPFRSP